MGPPGCKIIVHEKPGKRVLWSFTGLPGVYTGPFMNGYRTYKVYVPNTREDISVETVGIFPQSTKMYFLSATYAIIKVVSDIVQFL